MGIIRRTKSVKAVLHEFEQAEMAISTLELVDRFHDEMNRSTVYRILERLENDGTLHSFIGKDGMKWYAKCRESSASHQEKAHPHFQCKECGKTICLSMDLSIPTVPNHKVDSVSLLLIGSCEDCSSQAQ